MDQLKTFNLSLTNKQETNFLRFKNICGDKAKYQISSCIDQTCTKLSQFLKQKVFPLVHNHHDRFGIALAAFLLQQT